jgi:hypothetical protein
MYNKSGVIIARQAPGKNRKDLLSPGASPERRKNMPEDKAPQKTKRAEIEHNFTYHSPKPEQQPKYEQLRDEAKKLALLIHDLTPEGREQSLAITHLENCVMCANAAIARHT